MQAMGCFLFAEGTHLSSVSCSCTRAWPARMMSNKSADGVVSF